MRILIGADSRGICPRNHTWVNRFIQLSEHQVHTILAEQDFYLFSIYLLAEHLETVPNDHYDLVIIHSGWHEWSCWWTKDILKSMCSSYYNEDALTRKIEHEGHDKYLYQDEEANKKVFELINKKCRKCLCIGMHALRVENDLGRAFNQGMQHHYDNLESNQKFTEYADFLDMPMDDNWVLNNTTPDRIHFTAQGAEDLAQYLVRYANRLNKTVNSVVEDLYDEENDFYKKAKELAQCIAHGTNERDVVLIAYEDTEILTTVFLSCILANRIPLIIQTPSSKVSDEFFDERMQHIKDEANPVLCLADMKNTKRYGKFFTSCCYLSPLAPEYEISQPKPEDIAFYQMSSGTSGKSKLCKITHKQIIAHCEEYAKFINLDKSKSVVSWLPLYHDMGLVACFLLPLLIGAKFSVMGPFEWLGNPRKLLEEITERKATHIWMPSFAFNYMGKQDFSLEGIDLSSLEMAISCSEPTFIQDMIAFYKAFESTGLQPSTLSVCYALAENIFAVSQSTNLTEVEWKGEKYVSCGKTIPGVSVIILKDGEDVTGKDDGNILIKSNYEPQTNEKSDFYGYYNTGDIGFVINGELFVIGRQKDMFVSYGINIYPHIIEQEVSQLEDVISGRVVCFGKHNKEKGTSEIHIYAESEKLDVEIIDNISTLVKHKFDLPSKVYLVPPKSLVKNSAGKLCRTKNKEKFAS